MITTVYQKFVSRYAETFTYIENFDGEEYTGEMIPSSKVAKLTEEDFEELLNEVRSSENEKASWGECEYENDEDLRASHSQKWQEIDSFMDKMGI